MVSNREKMKQMERARRAQRAAMNAGRNKGIDPTKQCPECEMKRGGMNDQQWTLHFDRCF
jgi:hypothetical protein